MLRLRNILIGLVAIVLSATSLHSQKLSFVRTDVDSSRNKFITATYIFGIDIYAEDVENCTNVTFELRYNQTSYVRFSEWKKGNFGPSTKAYIIPLIDEPNDFGRIVVSCGLDNSIDTSAVDNPKVIHLEFSVIPAAPHFQAVNFAIFNPRATVVRDGVSEIIELESEPVNYTIHSYVNVYPGDADNNGVVDHLDFATVSYYLGMGPNTKRMRSFKREPASTLWAPQAVIAWDTAAATYADADGNGEVNMSDNLVVTYNYDKNHPTSKVPKVQSDLFVPKVQVHRTENSIVVPLFVNTWQSYLATSGKIVVNSFSDFDFLGIEPAGILAYDDLSFAFSHVSDESIDFIVGTVDKTKAIQSNGVIANLILQPKYIGNTINAPIVSGLKGISPIGSIFDMNGFTSVEDNQTGGFNVFYSDNSLNIYNLEYALQFIEIYDITGELILSRKIEDSQSDLTISLPNLPIGCYYLKMTAVDKIQSRSFMVY